MREIGVEIVGQGALKLTGFLRELMQQRNMNFESLYTVRTIKEVCNPLGEAMHLKLQRNTSINSILCAPLKCLILIVFSVTSTPYGIIESVP